MKKNVLIFTRGLMYITVLLASGSTMVYLKYGIFLLFRIQLSLDCEGYLKKLNLHYIKII